MSDLYNDGRSTTTGNIDLNGNYSIASKIATLMCNNRIK